MTCRQLIRFLDDYLADDLPPARKAEFERHLAVCAGCRDFLRAYQRTILLTLESAASDDAIPPDVPDDLIRAVEASAALRC